MRISSFNKLDGGYESLWEHGVVYDEDGRPILQTHHSDDVGTKSTEDVVLYDCDDE